MLSDKNNFFISFSNEALIIQNESNDDGKTESKEVLGELRYETLQNLKESRELLKKMVEGDTKLELAKAKLELAKIIEDTINERMTAVMVKIAGKTNEIVKEQISSFMFKVPEIFKPVADKVEKLEKENANIKVQLHNLSENLESQKSKHKILKTN